MKRVVLRLLGWFGVWCEWKSGHFYVGQRSVHVPAMATMDDLFNYPKVGFLHEIHLCEPHFDEGMATWKAMSSPGPNPAIEKSS